MKVRSRIILLVLVSSLFLTACEEDSGFSIAKHDDDYQEPENTMGERIEAEDDVIANSGSTGANDDKETPENENPDTGILPNTGEIEVETPTVDIGNHVVTFSINFEASTETNYINFSYVEDPFDQKYNFSYYTINDARLDNSNYCFKETINEKNTYKIYVGSSESGNYVIKFYNASGVQYGKAYISVKLDSELNNPSYISMAFNLVKVRFVAISFSVQNVFKKIGNFFSNLFGGDHISL